MSFLFNHYQILKRFVRKSLLKNYYYFMNSYSQYGEDLILNKLLRGKKNGFFIDIGAHHPSYLSNTYRFYKKAGWSGINIEPDPSLFLSFINERPNDINLNIGIGPADGLMPFYLMSASTLSTFSKISADRAIKEGHEIVNIENIPVLKLDSVFKRYCSEKSVDFMSVDVEGFEMDVLRSNDWVRFRPNYLIVEINQNTNKIMRFLKGVGYLNIFNNGTNCIFLDKNH